MSLIADKQTLDDLGIFGKRNNDSVFGIYNHTHTRGGAEMLEQMFRYPFSDTISINNRSAIIQLFKEMPDGFPFSASLFDAAEQYLDNTDERTRLSNAENTLERKFHNLIGTDTEYISITKGIAAIIEILISLDMFLQGIAGKAENTPYQDDIRGMKELMSSISPGRLSGEKLPVRLSYAEAVEYDHLLRYTHREKIKKLFYYIFSLDVYISVAGIASQRGFIFPRAHGKDEHFLKLDGVYHPRLSRPVPNSLHISPEKNIVFLTGANMAGKSTFMKSLGIAVYLAHMGFPVAAEKMEFSVRDGIFTTINLPDNLSMGASHFYAEVLRVKKVAMELRSGKNLFIIFDELFRGTNVKDAYEATVAITVAVAQKRSCIFLVSTHIIEAGQVLMQQCPNINFIYLPTFMDGNRPVYTYRLESGITDDRHGMIIINNEGIIEILKSRKNKTSPS